MMGVRCTPLRLRSFMEENATDGVVLWNESESRQVDLNDLERSLRNEIEPKDEECVWHQTGRISFPDDEKPASDEALLEADRPRRSV